MRKITLLMLIFAASIAQARETRHMSFTATIGTGFDMSRPSSVPLVGQIICHYNVGQRLAIGAGTGISLYEKPIVPLFADVRFRICKPRKFTPHIQCSAGYGFAACTDANGGIFVNPSVGLSYSLRKRLKLFVATGCELQKLERLKRFNSEIVSVEFVEKLSHNLIFLKVGIEF